MNHKLLDNWTLLRGYLVRQRQEYPGEPNICEATLAWIDTVLTEFVSVDPDSTVFRYPHAKNGTLYLQDKQHVNFTQLGKFMEPLSRWIQEMILATGEMVYQAL